MAPINLICEPLFNGNTPVPCFFHKPNLLGL